MGLESRDYLKDEERRYSQGGFGFGGGFGNSGGGYQTWTIVTWIIVINLLIWIADAFFGQAEDSNLHILNRFLALDPKEPWRLWSILTHGFAHSSLGTESGIWHILGNMVALFFLGRPIEQRLGRDEFIRFYLGGLLVSGLAFLVYSLATGSPRIVVGASGAVSAVVFLFVFCYPNVKLYLMGILPMPAWVLGVIMVATDVLRAFDEGSNVAWQAHLAGAAFGVAYYYFNWNFNWIDLTWFKNLFSGRPKLRIHDPDKANATLKREADAVLAKIAESGEDSLTFKERRILNRYSKHLRKSK